MSDETETEEKSSKHRRNMRAEADIDREPINKVIFKFLVRLFEQGFPQKLTLHVVFGPGGKRVGPPIEEFPIKTDKKPNHDDLIALANEILQEAQDDCDGLDKETSYGVFPHDTLRSDRPYSRRTFKCYPTGTSQKVAEARGDIVYEDEEGGGPSTKLLMSILGDERRDKRWMMEMLANIMSGSAERDAARIEQLEEQNTSNWDRSVKYISATETMLSQAEDRKARAARQEMYNDLLREGFDMLRTTVVPAIAAYASKGKVGISQGVKAFIDGLSEEAEEALFGKWEKGECVVAGVLDAQQVQHAIGIAEGRIDPKTVTAFVDGIRPDQQMAVQGLVERGVIKFTQVQALMALAKAARDISDKEEGEASEP